MRKVAAVVVLAIVLLADAARAAPPSKRIKAKQWVEVGEIIIEARHRKPLVLLVMPRRPSELVVPAAERALVPATLNGEVDSWLAARRAAAAAAKGRAPAARTLAERRRALGDVLGSTLMREIAERPGRTPGAYYVVATEALLETALDRYLSELEFYERLIRKRSAKDLPREPRLNLRNVLYVLDLYLERFPQNPLRADALYLRAWLAQEMNAPAAEIAARCRQATDTFPRHPFVAELHLRTGDAHATDRGPKALDLARQSYAAAAAAARPGEALRAAALFRLGWALHYQGDDQQALRTFLQLIAEGGGAGTNEIVADAHAFAALTAAATAGAASLAKAPLPEATRAELLGRGAEVLLLEGDEAAAVAWLDEAVRLAPRHRRASEWRAALDRTRALLRPAPASQPVRATKELVAHALRRWLTGFRHCYERALTTAPSLGGAVKLEFQWDNRGAVTAARLSGDASPGALGRCVQQRMAHVRLHPLGPAAARVRLVFKPAD